MAADPAAFSARYLSGGFVFMAGCSALWPRFGCSAGGARSPFPNWGRPGPRRPPVPHLWPGGLLPGRVLLRHSRPRRLAGVTFRVSPWPPTAWRSSPSSCMRPPAACSSFFCCTAWPGGAGRGGPFAGLSGRLRPVPLRPGISSGRCRPGDVGVFSTSQLLALVTLAAVLPLLIRHLRTYGKQPRL